MNVRIPTEKQILENPRRRHFVAGGWIDSSKINVIYIYWHKRQERFTVYSFLQVLEHEILHSTLARIIDLETSMKLDNVHNFSHVWLTEGKLLYVNRFRVKKWQFIRRWKRRAASATKK